MRKRAWMNKTQVSQLLITIITVAMNKTYAHLFAYARAARPTFK